MRAPSHFFYQPQAVYTPPPAAYHEPRSAPYARVAPMHYPTMHPHMAGRPYMPPAPHGAPHPYHYDPRAAYGPLPEVHRRPAQTGDVRRDPFADYPNNQPGPYTPQSPHRTVLNISPREFDALTRIAWYEGLRGYHGRHGLQPGINVAVSILNKRAAGMHPGLSQANPDYANKDIVGLINQPRRYEPVWRHGGGNVFNLQMSAQDRAIASAAVREAIVNLAQHWHPGTLFQQTSVTDRRGTSFIRSGERVLRDGVGHEFSQSYRGGARTVTPPYRIGFETLAMLGVGANQAYNATVPVNYRGPPPQRHIAYTPNLGRPQQVASASPPGPHHNHTQRYPAPSPYGMRG